MIDDSESDSDTSVDWLGPLGASEENEDEGDRDAILNQEENEKPGTSLEVDDNVDPVSEDLGSGGSLSKKGKYNVTFNVLWKKKYTFITEGKTNYQTKCIYCASEFRINHGGENDIIKHLSTMKHKTNVSASVSSKKINVFFERAGNDDRKKKTALAECVYVFHALKHSHSYNSSMSCGSKLFPILFPDSNVAAKFTCGRTKATKVVTAILAPLSKEQILSDLVEDHPFSIATDASDKGNIKTFPLIVRNFNKSSGVCTKLIRFFNLESKKSVDVANALVAALSELED
ncbi:hypothetical protein TcasGA2_TC001482 [Tribolium castaneum]|uniref:Uncharacterized protein n=1 Tax=Tribolium castaneum TaxID=7070 RepID=D7ELW0_TRICA|nr:hypothetical protein TcasGA2_TC001482 [Tribolium castaneum]